MNRETQRIVILLFLFAKIILGVWDLITDIIYTCTSDFHKEYLKYLMVFFMVITPFIMFITWSVTLGRIRLEQSKDIEIEKKRREMYLVNSGGLMQFIYRMIKVSIDEILIILKYSLKQMPLAFVITLLQTIKVFPFFIIAYTFKRFEVVITPELLTYASKQTTIYKKIMMEKLNNGQQYDEEFNMNGQTIIYDIKNIKFYKQIQVDKI